MKLAVNFIGLFFWAWNAKMSFDLRWWWLFALSVALSILITLRLIGCVLLIKEKPISHPGSDDAG